MIDDPKWRRSFLEDELSNQALAARWESHRDHLGEIMDA
jgi:hypothetical protein